MINIVIDRFKIRLMTFAGFWLITGVCINGLAVPYQPSQHKPPVVVLGVDGITFDLINPMVAKNQLPNFKMLLKNSAIATFNSERPMRSPALWTTIATGYSRKRHEIYDFVTGSAFWPRAKRNAKQKLVTSQMRKTPAIWQLTSQVKKKSLVVGWLNTWPAEPIHGVMVAPYVALGESRQTSIKGKIYHNVAKQSYPADEFMHLKSLIVHANTLGTKDLQPFVDLPSPHSPLFRKIPRLKRYLYTIKWSLASALTNFNIIQHELKKHSDFSLLMTYFDGADTLGHRFWLMREPISSIEKRLNALNLDPKLGSELKARFGHAVEAYYCFFDELLGKMLSELPPHSSVIIVSDHGFGNRSPERHIDPSVPFDGEHKIDGVFIGHGPLFRPGKYKAMNHYDIVPTVLKMLGIQKLSDMPGKSADHLLNMELLTRHNLLVVNKKTLPHLANPTVFPTSKETSAPFEDAEIERLRSLGYVQ